MLRHWWGRLSCRPLVRASRHNGTTIHRIRHGHIGVPPPRLDDRSPEGASPLGPVVSGSGVTPSLHGSARPWSRAPIGPMTAAGTIDVVAPHIRDHVDDRPFPLIGAPFGGGCPRPHRHLRPAGAQLGTARSRPPPPTTPHTPHPHRRPDRRPTPRRTSCGDRAAFEHTTLDQCGHNVHLEQPAVVHTLLRNRLQAPRG